MTGPHRVGTVHTAGDPLPEDADTRTPPATGASRNTQPSSGTGTVQPRGVASQACCAIQGSTLPTKARGAGFRFRHAACFLYSEPCVVVPRKDTPYQFATL